MRLVAARLVIQPLCSRLDRLPNLLDGRPPYGASVAHIHTAPVCVAMGVRVRSLDIDTVDADSRRANEPFGLRLAGVGDMNHLDRVGHLLKTERGLQILKRSDI